MTVGQLREILADYSDEYAVLTAEVEVPVRGPVFHEILAVKAGTLDESVLLFTKVREEDL